MCIYIHKLRVHCSFHANWCVFQTTHSSYTMRQPISPSRSRFEFIFWIICQAKYCVVRYRIYVLIRIINIFLSSHTYLHALLHVPMQKKKWEMQYARSQYWISIYSFTAWLYPICIDCLACNNSTIYLVWAVNYRPKLGWP